MCAYTSIYTAAGIFLQVKVQDKGAEGPSGTKIKATIAPFPLLAPPTKLKQGEEDL